MATPMSDFRILDWLGADGAGLGYYLHFLTLRYSISPETLARLREVAKRLEREPDYWRHVISYTGWRTQLIGCYALLITQNRDYLDALKIGLSGNPWISPQVAVTLGILHPSEALIFLAQWLDPNKDDAPKAVAAAYQVLLKLGASSAKHFDVKTFQDRLHPASGYRDESVWRYEFAIGTNVSQAHWDAWQAIISKELS
jgi:hypothetical protein